MSNGSPNPQDFINAAASAAGGVPKAIVDAGNPPPPPPPPRPSDDPPGLDDALNRTDGAGTTGGVWGRYH